MEINTLDLFDLIQDQKMAGTTLGFPDELTPLWKTAGMPGKLRTFRRSEIERFGEGKDLNETDVSEHYLNSEGLKSRCLPKKKL